MSVINSQPLIGASGNQGVAGYNIDRSLRFRSSASASLTKAAYGSLQLSTWTWSGWVKLGTLTSDRFFAVSTDRVDYANYFGILNNGTFTFLHRYANTDYQFSTNAVLRDPSAWYHLVVAIDVTQATATNRVKLYINGVLQTLGVSATITQNQATRLFGSASGTSIGGVSPYITSSYFDGYMAEMNFVDGQQLTPSDFGETDTITGVWKPKKYTGTYGTNGFYLKFNTLTSTSTLGNDSSGNSNTWTVNNVSLTAGATYDSMTDVPTLTSATAANYATLNAVYADSATSVPNLSNGNLKNSTTGSDSRAFSTIGMSSGKYYFEVNVGQVSNNTNDYIGVTQAPTGSFNKSFLYAGNGQYYNGSAWASYGATYTAGDVIGIALDVDNSTVEFYKNNASQGQKTGLSLTGLTMYVMAYNSVTSGNNVSLNFGQQGFTYTPPSGFVALNTFNLPDSTIVAGNKVMDATTYTGTLVSNAVTNAASFKPDLVWVKSRSAATDHKLTDSVRGVTKSLESNTTDAEATDTQGLTAFGSNGFTVGTDTNYNNLTATYVAWQWQAGQGVTSSNTAGTITSTVSVNAAAGFSIVTFTAPTSGSFTIGHGLGVAPSMIIAKSRSNAYSWPTYHKSIGNTGRLDLDSTSGTTTTSNSGWNNTSPTSTVFSMGSDWAGSGITYVAYCWSELEGFSKFGSYTGNGSTDGTFVYTGFRPKFVMVKCSSSDQAGNAAWYMLDSARNTYNAVNANLYANLSNAEAAADRLDFVSNGFKIRTTSTGFNASGATYVYAAFAENPFKNSLAR